VTDIDERDRRIIAAVACPYCHAPIAAPCVMQCGIPRGMPHSERTEAWRARAATATVAYRDNRERTIVEAVPCPYCGVDVGIPCARYPGSPIVTPPHRERRERWQETRPPVAPENPSILCACGHGAAAHIIDGCKRCGCQRSRAEVKAKAGRDPG